jgi:ELP3 family radical SAM enzyme/protein acetyltransferase
MDIEDLRMTTGHKQKPELTEEQTLFLKDILIKNEFDNTFNLIKDIQRIHKFTVSKIDLIKIYNSLDEEYKIYDLKKKIIKKIQKSESGILSVTIISSGSPWRFDKDGKKEIVNFTCKNDCYYCPNEGPSKDNNFTRQPRSYLTMEPGLLRSNSCGFDPIKQMNSRLSTLEKMGHTIDKLEVLVLGGTWSSYPKEYQEEFVTHLYYAANTYYDKRETILSLEEEIELNEKAKVHIIGLTLETRSDSININEIKNFRRYNCTRIQIGIQHTDNAVLKMNNRGESIEKVKKAIKMLKNNNFKIDGHLMLNLYGSTVEKDRIMLNEILTDPDLQVDQLKIYPCAIVPFTKIKELYEAGIYKPYDDCHLYDLIKEFKMKITKQFRINRIIRDIPGDYIIDGYSQQFASIRQKLHEDMKINNWSCKCIRCREVKGNKIDDENTKLEIMEYEASGGIEYYISYENGKYLIGFIRLRLNKNKELPILPVLEDAALIRELHVYSALSNVGENDDHSLQHKGYGRRLIEKAEEIAISNGFHKMAIISGTGVRNYYRKFGYELKETYMIKELIAS